MSQRFQGGKLIDHYRFSVQELNSGPSEYEAQATLVLLFKGQGKESFRCVQAPRHEDL
jgi:hypothetical protein